VYKADALLPFLCRAARAVPLGAKALCRASAHPRGPTQRRTLSRFGRPACQPRDSSSSISSERLKMWIFYPFPPASPPPPSQFSDSPAPALGPAFRSTRSCHNNHFSGPRSPGGLRTGTPPRCRRAGAIGHVDCIRFKRSAIEELEVLGRIGDCAALFSKKLIVVFCVRSLHALPRTPEILQTSGNLRNEGYVARSRAHDVQMFALFSKRACARPFPLEGGLGPVEFNKRRGADSLEGYLGMVVAMSPARRYLSPRWSLP